MWLLGHSYLAKSFRKHLTQRWCVCVCLCAGTHFSSSIYGEQMQKEATTTTETNRNLLKRKSKLENSINNINLLVIWQIIFIHLSERFVRFWFSFGFVLVLLLLGPLFWLSIFLLSIVFFHHFSLLLTIWIIRQWMLCAVCALTLCAKMNGLAAQLVVKYKNPEYMYVCLFLVSLSTFFGNVLMGFHCSFVHRRSYGMWHFSILLYFSCAESISS